MAEIETNNVDVNATNPPAEPSTDDKASGGDTTAKSTQEMLAELMAENKRLKKSLDKAASEAAGYKKQYMSTKSEQEQAAIQKAEADAAVREELETLRRESQINKFAKNFMSLGYSEQAATQAATAQYDGDMDTLFQIQRSQQAEYQKAVRAQLMKDMPSPSVGNDEGISVTREEFENMSYSERLNLKVKHPQVYEQLMKR